MRTINDLIQEIRNLDGQRRLDEARQLLDRVARSSTEIKRLANNQTMSEPTARGNIGALYNNIGISYLQQAAQLAELYGKLGEAQATTQAEYCFSTAFPFFGLARPEDVLYLPGTFDLHDFITNYWGMGRTYYLQRRVPESRRFLELCLRLPARNPASSNLQTDARHLLASLPQR